jgi:hypothetical protein
MAGKGSPVKNRRGNIPGMENENGKNGNKQTVDIIN